MIVKTMKQYSPEYWQAKLGRPSASKMAKFVTSTGKKGSQWKAECYKLAAELERGCPEETYQSIAMKEGLEREDEARKSFEFITKIKIDEVGVVYPSFTDLVCCSPDGLKISQKVGLEIKCPTPGTHIKYRHEGVLPTDYKPQVYSSLWMCDELERYYFYSYHPDMKPFITWIDRNDEGYKIYAEALENYLPDMLLFIHEVAGTLIEEKQLELLMGMKQKTRQKKIA